MNQKYAGFKFPNRVKIGLWDLACSLTGQNATDEKPTNETRNILAELVAANRANKLWFEWRPGFNFDFISGEMPKAGIGWVRTDWHDLDNVTVRREDWERFNPAPDELSAMAGGAPAPKAEAVHDDVNNKVRIPVAKQQDSVILEWLKENNYDPLNLPVGEVGKAGVRSICKADVRKNASLFQSDNVFITAWDRLRTNGETQVKSNTHP
jgi:hypothetical protein